jgi:broad specificity phosphatase PhoE
MGSIVLVRHAQGSFFSDDYDQLSPEGLRQADQLGEYWRAQSISFTEEKMGRDMDDALPSFLRSDRFQLFFSV